MTVTAIVVVNHENKMVTSRNPLLRIKEVEEFIAKHIKGKPVILDTKQYDLRKPQCVSASKLYCVHEDFEKSGMMPGTECIRHKTMEFIVKRHVAEHEDITLVLSATGLMRVKHLLNRVIVVTINNKSRETETVPSELFEYFEAKVRSRKMTALTHKIATPGSVNETRFSVKDYS